MAITKTRKKVNFMINKDTIELLQAMIPAGERSDFVNNAIEINIKKYRQLKAIDNLKEFYKKTKPKLSTKEFLELKNYGRL